MTEMIEVVSNTYHGRGTDGLIRRIHGSGPMTQLHKNFCSTEDIAAEQFTLAMYQAPRTKTEYEPK